MNDRRYVVLAALLLPLKLAHGQTPTLTGNNAFTGNSTIPNISSVVDVDGNKYALTAAGINQALTDACNGTVPGRVVLPMGAVTGVSASISVPSNCVLDGSGPGKSVVQASAGLAVPVVLVSGKTGVILQNFTADANTNSIDAIQVTNGTNIKINDVRGTNAGNGSNAGNGLTILNASSFVTVQDSEFDHAGAVLPSADGSGVSLSPGLSSMSHIKLLRNRVHDNNQGIAIFNSSNSASLTGDIEISQNTVYANGNDGINAASQGNPTGSLLIVRIVDNESYCNGWPVSGTGFSAHCTAGAKQTGASASPTGVGIDITGPLTVQSVITNNRVHDNVFDGISDDARYTGSVTTMVKTSGTTVTRTSGTNFNISWKASEPVIINNVMYQIASVSSSSSLTLATSAGPQTAVQFFGPVWVQNTFSANESYYNGVGSIGTGIYNQSADGNVYTRNIATFNNLGGLVCNACSFTSYDGDRANSNYRGSGSGFGFVSSGSLSNSYIDVSADDPVASPTQTAGLLLDANSSNALVVSPSLFGNSFLPGVKNNGTGNIFLRPAIGNLGIESLGQGTNFTDAGMTTLKPWSLAGMFTQTLQAATDTIANRNTVEIRTNETLQNAVATRSEPSCSSTGIGITGACTLAAASSNMSGAINLTPGGTGISSSGTLTLTFTTAAPNRYSCGFTFANGWGAFTGPGRPSITSQTSSATAFQWTNGAALLSGHTYFFNYVCQAQ